MAADAGRLAALVRQFSATPVAVIGDVMLDEFIIGRVDRISPEAPVPVLRFERSEHRLGGAANVAHNIQTLGGAPDLVGMVGDDEAGRMLRDALRSRGIGDRRIVVSEDGQTTRKVRLVTSRNQQVARVDYEEDAQVDTVTAGALCAAAQAAAEHAGAIVISDYRKGVVSDELLACAIAAAGATPTIVDPKIPVARRYEGATLLTPNHHEAELMTGIAIRTPEDARTAARRLHDLTGASILITWGERGMWLLDASASTPAEDAIPAAAREVADVTGAGDTVAATLALALASGAPLGDAARLANAAAGIVVGRFGPATVTADELIARL